jgi:SAM-dependent methyltransferase
MAASSQGKDHPPVVARAKSTMTDIRAASFDAIAGLYSRARPSYPDDVYQEMEKHISFSRETKILEIGAGDGKATEDLCRWWSPRIVALEPGLALCGLLKKRFSANQQVKVVISTFEDFDHGQGEPFDCILSATAFHWVDKEIGYAKAADLLKPKGVLVLYWNNFSRNDDPIFDEMAEIYSRYLPGGVGKRDIRHRQEEIVRERRREMEENGHFLPVSHGEYLHTRKYDARGYVDLLRTFSENSTKEGNVMEPFYNAMEDLIRQRGDRVDLPIQVNLEIGEKRAFPLRKR